MNGTVAVSDDGWNHSRKGGQISSCVDGSHLFSFRYVLFMGFSCYFSPVATILPATSEPQVPDKIDLWHNDVSNGSPACRKSHLVWIAKFTASVASV